MLADITKIQNELHEYMLNYMMLGTECNVMFLGDFGQVSAKLLSSCCTLADENLKSEFLKL